jgi:hypothetical protein
MYLVECSLTILVIRTKSEAIGFAFQPKATKFEARNPKYETNPNDQNSNDQNNSSFPEIAFALVLVIRSFEFRISNFGFKLTTEVHALRA